MLAPIDDAASMAYATPHALALYHCHYALPGGAAKNCRL